MNNPYDILGVSKNASTEELKQAYRHLAFKYHPNNYEDNPLADIAESKLKELDEAYDAIMNERAGVTNNAYDDNNDNKYSSSSYEYPDVREHIKNDRLDDAITILDGIPVEMRTAEWYFLKGQIQQNRGWIEEANKNYITAIEMDPYNDEYNKAYEQLNNPYLNKRFYKGRFGRAVRNFLSGCGVFNLCLGLCCLDSCCGCCGDDCC